MCVLGRVSASWYALVTLNEGVRSVHKVVCVALSTGCSLGVKKKKENSDMRRTLMVR